MSSRAIFEPSSVSHTGFECARSVQIKRYPTRVRPFFNRSMSILNLGLDAQDQDQKTSYEAGSHLVP